MLDKYSITELYPLGSIDTDSLSQDGVPSQYREWNKETTTLAWGVYIVIRREGYVDLIIHTLPIFNSGLSAWCSQLLPLLLLSIHRGWWVPHLLAPAWVFSTKHCTHTFFSAISQVLPHVFQGPRKFPFSPFSNFTYITTICLAAQAKNQESITPNLFLTRSSFDQSVTKPCQVLSLTVLAP